MKKLLLLIFLSQIGLLSLGQVVSTFPHIEDFETQPLGSSSCGSVYSFNQTTPTWLNGDDATFPSGLHQYDWIVDEGGTPSSNTGPSIDHTNGSSLGNYAYIESSCPSYGSTSQLISPWFDFSSLQGPTFEFWYHMFGSTMGTMSVDVQVGSAGAWNLSIIPDWTNNIDLWQKKTVFLSAYAGLDSVRIRIRNVTGTSFTSDVAIDDLMVFEPQPYDFAATELTTDYCGLGLLPISCTIQNVGSDTIFSGDSIYMYYDDGITYLAETAIFSDTIYPGEYFEYIFSGFANMPNPVSYNLMAWCRYPLDSIFTNDTIEAVVYPKPIVNTYPYLENFENGKGGWNEINNATGTWAFGTPAKSVIIGASSGVNAWVSGGLTGNYNANDNSWVLGPCFDFTTLDTGAYVSMKVWWYCEFSWDGANLQWSTDNGSSWNNIGNYGDPYHWYNDNTITGNPGGSQIGWSGTASTGSGSWVKASHILPDTLIGMSSVNFRVAFGSDGSVSYEGFAFDDFWIGMPYTLDTTMADYNGCPPYQVTYGTPGDYYWEIQDTSTFSLRDFGSDNIGNIALLTNTGASDSTYYLIVNFSDASGTNPFSDTVLVTLLPEPYNVLLDTSICWNNYATYHVDSAPYYSYLWNDIMSSTVDSANYYSGGSVSVTVTHTGSGCSHTADAMIYQFPAVNLPSTVHYCAGDSAFLNAGSGYESYNWSTSDTTPGIIVSTPGAYYIVTMDSLACISVDSVLVTTGSLPIPVITGQQDTLCNYSTMVLNAGSGFSVYSWSTGGTAENETIDGSALPLGLNTITVMVSDSYGCNGSDSVVIVIDECLGLDEFEAFKLTIYPNPSNGQFMYTINNMSESVLFIVTDVIGKTILQGEIYETQGVIDLSSYEDGVYILQIHSGSSMRTVQLIKQ
ncbi:MAG: T9SS type A sorting domain-containing protein [Bacteroidales bacterium]|nr:T9SS type A sorting domain-containing protein [Bacteroidales bacterium]